MLTLTPIGTIRTPYADRYDAPRQPGAADTDTARRSGEGIIELAQGMNFEQALEDLAGFEFIWLLYWFDRNTTWKPKVLPPRGERKRGLFATRSPHRPNPIGLSLVRLLSVEGRTIRVADVDLLDGTPILDIKPYIPGVEAHPDARAGWLDELNEVEAIGAVHFSDLAAEQTAWLAAHGVDIGAHAVEVLSRHRTPHPYRRISARDDGTLELAVRSWRLAFRVEGTNVTIERIGSGYTAEAALAPDAADRLHDGAAHAGFHRQWDAGPE